ncbi:MAG: PAS domain S-box protein [Anaerolineae bacterium]|nr:PAS domain S-box protein [Anaerolineae bacterium]
MSSGTVSLHVLVVTEAQATVDLLEQVLRRAGYAPVIEHIHRAEAVRVGRRRPAWELVLAEAGLWRTVSLADRPRIPVIVFADPADADAAPAAAMETGADDYVLLDDRGLARLGFSIQRALHAGRLRAAEASVETEARLHLLAGLTYIYLYVMRIEPDGALAYEWGVGDVEELTGFTLEEVVARGWFRMVHPDDLPIAERRWQDLLAGNPHIAEYRFIAKDGKVRWVRDYGYPVWDEEEGRVTYVYGAAQDITAQQQVEAELQRQMHFAQTLIDALPVPVFYEDTEGVYLGCNTAFEQFSGVPRQEIIGSSVYDLYSPELADKYHAMDEALFNQPGKQIYESTLQDPGGDNRNVIFHRATFAHLDGTLGGLIGAILDITEHKRTEGQLRESETLYRTLIGALPDAITVTDAEGRVTFVSPKALEVYGVDDVSKALGKPAIQGIAPEDRERAVHNISNILEGEEGKTSQYTLLKQDGTRFVGEVKSVHLRDAAGYIMGMVSITRDITQHRQMEDALRASEERFRTAFHTSPDSININRLHDGLYVDVNEGFTALTGYTREETVGRTSFEINIWYDFADRARLVEGLRAQGYVNNLEARFRLKDGRVRTGLMSAKIIHLNGEPHILSITRDIEDRIQAEAALRESEQQYRRLFEDAVLGIFRSTPGGKVITVNPAFARMFGYDSPEDVLASINDVATSVYVDPPRRAEIVRRIMASRLPIRMENRYRRKDGSIFTGNLHIWRVDDEDGNFLYLEGFVEDITKRKEAEAELAWQAGANAAIAELSSALIEFAPLTKVASLVLEKAVQLTGSPFGFVSYLDPYAGFLVSTTPPQDSPGSGEAFVFEESRKLWRWMLVHRCAILSNDLAEDVQMRGVLSERLDVSRLLAVPAAVGENLIGQIVVVNAGAGYSIRDLELLKRLAAVYALAFQRNRAQEILEERTRTLQTLHEVALDIGAEFDMSVLIERIMVRAIALLGVDRGGGIFLYDPQSDLLQLAEGHRFDFDLNLAQSAIRPGEGMVGHVFQTGETFVVDDYSQWEGRLPAFAPIGSSSVIAVPLLWREEVIGVLTLFADRNERTFDLGDIWLAEMFAAQAAISIVNARLVRTLETHNERLEEAVEARTADLRRNHERTETILDNSPDSILLLRADGAVELFNRTFREVFGYRHEQVYQKSPTMLVLPDQADTFDAAVRRACDRGERQHLIVVAQRSDRTTFDADVLIAPIRAGATVTGLVCSLHDVSALKQVERMKDAFVSNVSHELRTPIASLKLYHDLLRRRPDRRDVYMDRLDRETERLSGIIEDLLYLSRMDQGRIQVKRSTVNFNDLAGQYVLDRTPLAERRNLRLAFVGEPGLMPVQADPGLIGQALGVLLTNAINYTPAGGRIEVKTQNYGLDGQPGIRVSVADTGPGVRLEEQPQLFTRFFRGEAGRNSGEPGTGLGLAITKEIVERHGGHIAVESAGVPGEGATFHVWLPGDAPPEPG